MVRLCFDGESVERYLWNNVELMLSVVEVVGS